MGKHLDENGLFYLWQQLKGKLNGKVDKEEGMGLSANSYTDQEKTKLDGIAEGANKTVVNNTLTSTSADEALAAAQGKALSERIDGVEARLSDDDNDLTNALKANYDAAYAHSQAAHAPASAQENVIETLKVNGAAQAVSDKAVDITVPTTVAALSDAGDYAKKSDIANVYKYQGSVTGLEQLPGENNTAGDVYNVEETGMNYAWTGSQWDALGQLISITCLTNEEIDAILAC
jgi:hypothetical protein